MTFKCTNGEAKMKVDLDPIEQHIVLSQLWHIATRLDKAGQVQPAFEKAHFLLGALFNGTVTPTND